MTAQPPKVLPLVTSEEKAGKGSISVRLRSPVGRLILRVDLPDEVLPQLCLFAAFHHACPWRIQIEEPVRCQPGSATELPGDLVPERLEHVIRIPGPAHRFQGHGREAGEVQSRPGATVEGVAREHLAVRLDVAGPRDRITDQEEASLILLHERQFRQAELLDVLAGAPVSDRDAHRAKLRVAPVPEALGLDPPAPSSRGLENCDLESGLRQLVRCTESGNPATYDADGSSALRSFPIEFLAWEPIKFILIEAVVGNLFGSSAHGLLPVLVEPFATA